MLTLTSYSHDHLPIFKHKKNYGMEWFYNDAEAYLVLRYPRQSKRFQFHVSTL
jgi:hypothetical protein